MKTAYLYPISGRLQNTPNPYLDDFMDTLEDNFYFLNRKKPSNIGLFDILKYIGSIEYVFFHWPENISEKKFGWVQSILFFFLIPVFTINNVNIIYIVHNKISHTKNNYLIKKLISKTLIKHSLCIITHSKDGITFINSLFKNKNKIFYFPHPVLDERPLPVMEKDIDILIWGNIAPYKGIHRFIEQIKENRNYLRWQVVIAGKVSSKAYLYKINNNKPENVKIINEYIDDNNLKILISRSKIVLFPYHAESILSSGAFAKSIIFPVHIIGPDCGSFSDFKHYKHIDTFKNENEMIELIKSKLSSKYEEPDLSDEIILKYSWQNFGKSFFSVI